MIILKALFKNKTAYSKKIYDRFLEFHRNKFGFKYKLYNIIVIGTILACIVYSVGYKAYTTSVVFCIILVIFIIWRSLKPVAEVSKDYNSDKVKKSTIYTFNFYDKYFTVQDKKTVSKIKYYKLYRLFQTKDFFYLYIDKSHAFLIDKSGFFKGNSVDFYKFIKTRNFKLLLSK